MTMICINGKQIKPPGQSGIYFICQHGRYKGNHCRWARWCKESHSYISATDKYGNVCPDFSTTEIAEEQKTIDERTKEILKNPCTKNLEPKEVVEDPIKNPVENIVKESAEETIEIPTEETIKEPITEPTEMISKKSGKEISDKIIEDIANAIVDELTKQPVAKADDNPFEYPVIEPLKNE